MALLSAPCPQNYLLLSLRQIRRITVGLSGADQQDYSLSWDAMFGNWSDPGFIWYEAQEGLQVRVYDEV